MKKESTSLSTAVENFDRLPDSALAGIRAYTEMTGRSRCSFYRDAARGLFSPVKIGGSVRVRIGDLRRLIGCPTDELAA